MDRKIGLFIVAAGCGLVLVGLFVYLGWGNWFGRLPGDIRYESPHVKIYVPIVTMILVSALLSVILYIIRRFF